MAKKLSPPRPKLKSPKAAQPMDGPLHTKYIEESCPMTLSEAMRYFSSALVKEFLVSDGVFSPKEHEGINLGPGDVFIVYVKKAVSFLKLRPAVPSPGSDPVTVPVTSQTEFALTPRCEDSNGTDAATWSWEREFQSVGELIKVLKSQDMPVPCALKVLKDALDHNRQKVSADTILFNICQVSQWIGLQKRQGIKGVDSSGTVHRFLEGEHPLYFSTRLYDVKCSPMYFANVLQFPQMARVYLHPKTDKKEDTLQNLSTVTITNVVDDHDPVVRKLSDNGDKLGPLFTVPWNADLKVVGVKLTKSDLLDEISHQRCIVKAKSCSSLDSHEDASVNAYSDDFNEATRGGLQAGRKEDAYYNAVTSTHLKGHDYVNLPDAVVFVNPHSLADGTAPSTSHQYYNMTGKTEPIEESDNYVLIESSTVVHYPTAALSQSAHAPKTPITITLTSCPTEPELHFHVASKLGKDWHSVGTYLGLQYYQLDQADVAHSQLEDKAMEVLMIWLKKPESAKAPHSWETLLRALCLAGRNDMASDLERDIRNGKLQLSDRK